MGDHLGTAATESNLGPVSQIKQSFVNNKKRTKLSNSLMGDHLETAVRTIKEKEKS